MDTQPTRVFTPARIVALALIAVLIGMLGYVRFGRDLDPAPVSVPRGATEGELMLEPCEYSTEDGEYPADCGTLVARENPDDPASRLIALPVTRIRAQSERPAEPIFILQGGPGMTNMSFDAASRFNRDHDVVLVGYRGVDGSVRLECPEVKSALKRSNDRLSETFFRTYGDAYRACADRLVADGIDPAGYGLGQQVDDFEAVRVTLGYDRVNLLSESAGTRTAMIYAWQYPGSINRSVMFGTNPPGNFLWDPSTTDEQIDRYAELCSADARCGARTDDLTGTMRDLAAHVPARWFFLPINEDNVKITSFFGLMESTTDAFPVAGPMVVDSWLSAAAGDASGLWLTSVLGDLLLPELFVRGQYAAAARIDAEAARDYFASARPEHASNLGYVATAIGWGGGEWLDSWPAAVDEGDYNEVRPSEVETLVIGGALDFATPPQIASRELLPALPNGHEIVLPGIGHTGSFLAAQPAASTQLITAFFESGRVDDSLYRPEEVDFTPAVTLPTIAKIVAGTMISLAFVTVVSLLWMARRVHRRGRFGSRASVILRSLYALVLGVGGWFVGVLIVLTTLPGVSLDNEILAVLAAGGPVGLGTYLAWVNQIWPVPTRVRGLVAALAGGLVGAWLGFNATGGLPAVITATVGTAAGANLALIFLDVYEARRGRRHVTSALSVGPEGESIRV